MRPRRPCLRTEQGLVCSPAGHRPALPSRLLLPQTRSPSFPAGALTCRADREPGLCSPCLITRGSIKRDRGRKLTTDVVEGQQRAEAPGALTWRPVPTAARNQRTESDPHRQSLNRSPAGPGVSQVRPSWSGDWPSRPCFRVTIENQLRRRPSWARSRSKSRSAPAWPDLAA